MTEVSSELVRAAIAAARDRGQDVAEVPLTALAAAAGISRSTLLRRLGGSRAPLDEAVSASGVDPGGRAPVADRAVEAAARLIADRGLGALTLDAVAAAAECSVPSLHASLGGRDGLLTALFERYGPLPSLEELAADPPESLRGTVIAIYGTFARMISREPRVVPALMADLFARPEGPASRTLRANIPRMLESMGKLLGPHLAAGALRPLPIPLLIQQMLGPLAVHLLLRRPLEPVLGDALPDVDEAVTTFADAFLRAASTTEPEE
jgi:AcrR family transcriptional regulator